MKTKMLLRVAPCFQAFRLPRLQQVENQAWEMGAHEPHVYHLGAPGEARTE